MEMKNVKKIAHELMSKHGLEDFKLEWTASTPALGICQPYNKKIVLSIPWMKNLCEKQVRNVCLHEIAHGLEWRRYGRILQYNQGHSTRFQDICVEIGATASRYYLGKPLKKLIPKFEIYNVATGEIYYKVAELPDWCKGDKIHTIALKDKPETKGKLGWRKITMLYV